MSFAHTKLSRLGEHRDTWDGTSLYAAKAPYDAHLEGIYHVEICKWQCKCLPEPDDTAYTTANVRPSVMICQTSLWQ